MSSFTTRRTKPTTPVEWVDYLSAKLLVQARNSADMNNYYEGRHSVKFSQTKFKNAYAEVIGKFSDNFCSLIVDSVAERLAINGFRMTDDPNADSEAWDIWQRNDMDSRSVTAMTEALVSGRAYVTVWRDDVSGQPVIRCEDASELIVHYEDGLDSRKPTMALKRWTDDWGVVHARLWTPTQSFKVHGLSGNRGFSNPEIAPNPLGVVPVIELANRPRIHYEPTSELKLVAPIQDSINKVVRDALVASEFAAFPQRWVTGLDIELDEDGQPKPPAFNPALDRLFQAEDSNVTFGQFAAADLSNYVRLTDMLVQHIATVSRVPFHYFLINGGQAPSGEAITSAEAGLVAKVRDRQMHFGDAWERVMRLAFLTIGDPKAQAVGAETMWRDPEYRTESQHIDALMKLKALGVPLQQLWSDAGYSPAQIERFDALRAQEAQVMATSLGIDQE